MSDWHEDRRDERAFAAQATVIRSPVEMPASLTREAEAEAILRDLNLA